MKYVLVVLAGAADQPTPTLGERTPLESAKMPNVNFFAKMGKVGTYRPFQDKSNASADLSLFSLLGYDSQKEFPGRAALEAANQGLECEENEVVFCTNFITESDGNLADAKSGDISTKESKALINFLNKKLASDFVRFYAGSEYRHLTMIKDSHGQKALSAKTNDPRLVQGESLESVLPKGPGDELLKKLMYDAKLLLQDHEVNEVRVDLGENPANMIWLWGQGKTAELQGLADKYHFGSGAVIATREFARGLGSLAGLTVMDIKQEGLEYAEYYEKIAKLMVDVLEEKDLLVVHLHSVDEASLAGDLNGKISALESMDFFIFSKLRYLMEKDPELRILLTPSHATHHQKRQYSREEVPFLVAGKNIVPDDVEKFTESAAKASNLHVKSGHDLMSSFFSGPVGEGA